MVALFFPLLLRGGGGRPLRKTLILEFHWNRHQPQVIDTTIVLSTSTSTSTESSPSDALDGLNLSPPRLIARHRNAVVVVEFSVLLFWKK
jgi:hypothetical protein